MNRNTIKKIVVVITVNTVVLLTLLIIFDLLFRAMGTQIDKAAVAVQSESKKSVSFPNRLLNPYIGWIETPGTILKERLSQSRINLQSENDPDPDWLYITRNSLGFVSKFDIPLTKNENDYVIAVMGGSVAMWFVLQTSKEFIIQLNQHRFFKEKNIILFNLASGGYKQPQQLNLLNFILINSFVPDMVINIDGFNEAALAYANLKSGISPAYPSHSHWTHLTKGFALSGEIRKILGKHQRALVKMKQFSGLAQKFSFSSILSFIFLKQQERWKNEMTHQEILYIEKSETIAKDTRKLTIKGPNFSTDLNDIATIWQWSSKLMHDICTANQIRYFHILQPTPHDPDSIRQFTKEELKRIGSSDHLWAQGVRLIYPMLKAKAEELKDWGVLYKDLNTVFLTSTESIYYDICHFNQEGNEIVARAIASYIKENLISHYQD
ncbi:MAG: hypothetical protein K8R67_07965 [Desulfobacteraceae bacterium]|nr:hypothetical protein [Desulfobacteraceae bacterium]